MHFENDAGIGVFPVVDDALVDPRVGGGDRLQLETVSLKVDRPVMILVVPFRQLIVVTVTRLNPCSDIISRLAQLPKTYLAYH